MNDRDRNNIQRLITIYEKRIDNIQYHIDNNCSNGLEMQVCNQRLRDHKDFLSDLKSLAS